MATILTEPAQAGYDPTTDGTIKPNPYLFSSPSFYAFEAGRRMWAMGFTRPIKATMGRGYTVNLWTASNQFKATFPGDSDLRQTIVTRL